MSAKDISAVTSKLADTKVGDDFELSFAGKSLKLDGEKEAKEITDAIAACDNLKALRLDGNTMGIEAAKCIGKALEKHPEFERALWSDMFTGRLKTEIPDALRALGDGIIKAGACLTVLDLSDNAFGPNGMKGLTDFLSSASCYSLQELKLHNNGLGITGGKMLANSLLKCHANSVKAGKPLALKVFISGRGRLENEGSIALAEAFKAMGSLEEVQMPQNGIYHPGITALAEAFAHNKNLRHLNLQDNTFTDVGAKAMAKTLPHLQKLEILNFADCLLRDKGARSIAKGFTEHKLLSEVNLCANEIRASGATALTEALSGLPRLDKLDLGCNELGADAIDTIKALLDDKEDILCVSDDEGTPDPSEDEHEEEEEEDDDEGEEVTDPGLQVQGVAITPRAAEQTVSAADFLAFPSPNKLSGLGENRAQAIVQQLGDDIDNMEEVMKVFMKISSFVTAENPDTKQQACTCADALLSAALETAEENVSINFSNSLLVHMGILKSEDKKFRAPKNISGALTVLEHCVQQQYFPGTTRDFLQVFLGKPHPVLEAHPKPRAALLKTLFRF